MTLPITTPRGDVSIRIATAQDADQLYNLRLEALRMHPDAFAADVDITAANGVEAWVTLIENYARDQSGAVIMASTKDNLIGMTGILCGHWPKTRHNATLWGMYVKPAWRRLHICEAMIKCCLKWAMENQIMVVKLGVNTSNTNAIRCYTHCGFSTYGTEPRAVYERGVYHDEYLMAKILDKGPTGEE
jgi:RimJ/RimL family protein N-acetyltransferase